jgi:hypothetical protein
MAVETLPLWPVPPARAVRRTDPATSQRAARAPSCEPLVLAMFRQHGPMTDDEVCARLPDLHPPTVKSARSRLAVHQGLLFDTGVRRPSLRGAPMFVWAAVEETSST